MSQINWETVKEYQDITYKKSNGVARIAFNRPDVRNAFRPKTTSELYDAFYDANEDVNIGVVLLSAEGPSYGSAYLAKMVGQKRAREIFFLGRSYSAQEAYDMGMVNAVVPHAELEDTAYEWAQEILGKSPTSIRMLKFAMNLTDDGMVGQQVFAGEATRLAYMTDEAIEGRNAFLEKRKPNFEKKWIP